MPYGRTHYGLSSNTPIAVSSYWGLIAVPSSNSCLTVDFLPLDDVVPMSFADASKVGRQPRHPCTFTIGGPAEESILCSVTNRSQRILINESLGTCSTSMYAGIDSDLAFSGVLSDTGPVLFVTDTFHHSVHILDVGKRMHAGFLATPGLLPSPSRLACRDQLVVVQTKKENMACVYFVFEYCNSPSRWQVMDVFKGVLGCTVATSLRFQCEHDPVFVAAYPGDCDVDYEGVYHIGVDLSYYSRIYRRESSRKCKNVQIIDADTDADTDINRENYFVARCYKNVATHAYDYVVEHMSCNMLSRKVVFYKRCWGEYELKSNPMRILAHPGGGVLIVGTGGGAEMLLWAGTASQLRKVNMSKIRIAWMATVIRRGALCSERMCGDKMQKIV